MISDELITKYIGSVFGDSEPGAALHHLLVASVDPAKRDALGRATPEVRFYAIAPDESVDTEEFIVKTIIAAAIEGTGAGREIHFAALGFEAHRAPVESRKARALKAERRLHEHPMAVEVTLLYAACADGRRWVGQHILTGPQAGRKVGPLMRAGALAPDEQGRFQFLIRALVERDFTAMTARSRR